MKIFRLLGAGGRVGEWSLQLVTWRLPSFFCVWSSERGPHSDREPAPEEFFQSIFGAVRIRT